VCCSVLQCIAVCCSALQCVAVCCSMWQCVAVCCSVSRCVAVCCNMLQCVAVCRRVLQSVLLCLTAVESNYLAHTAQPLAPTAAYLYMWHDPRTEHTYICDVTHWLSIPIHVTWLIYTCDIGTHSCIPTCVGRRPYGVATISRLLKITGLFCRISSNL